MMNRFLITLFILVFSGGFSEAGKSGDNVNRVKTFICSVGSYDISGKSVFIEVSDGDKNSSSDVSDRLYRFTKVALEKEGAISVNDPSKADYFIHLSYRSFLKHYTNKNNVSKESFLQKQRIKENSSYLSMLPLQDMPDEAKESDFKETKKASEVIPSVKRTSNKGFKEFIVSMIIEDNIIKKEIGSLWVSVSTSEKGDTSNLAPFAIYLTKGKYGNHYKKWQTFKLHQLDDFEDFLKEGYSPQINDDYR